MKVTSFETVISHSSAVYSIAPADEDQFYSAGADHFVALWHCDPLEQLPFSAKLEQAVYSCIYISGHQLLIAGTSSGDFHVLDMAARKELRHIIHHHNGIYDFAFDKSDHQLIIAGGDGKLSVWSVPGFELIRTIPVCDGKIRQLALSADQSMLAMACGDGKVRVTDLIFFNEIGTIDAHDTGATSVCWHPSKPVLISGGKDAMLRCWNINRSFEEVLSIAAHQFAIYSIVFDPTGKYCATASRDKTIKIWNAATFEPILKIGPGTSGHSHSVNKLIWKPHGLISCGDDRKINTYRFETEK